MIVLDFAFVKNKKKIKNFQELFKGLVLLFFNYFKTLEKKLIKKILS
jgi:inorganic pyrophosphatase